jgi:signal transduction histidine kinase
VSLPTTAISPPAIAATMRDRIHQFDWAGTGLGGMESWPISLRSTVTLMLASKFPMYVIWGPQRRSLYNDAFIPILGSRHPDALGMPISALWSDVWPQIAPLVDAAFNNETSYFEDLPLQMTRNGYVEQTYFTFSYSGLENDAGEIAGMLCVCLETTAAFNARQQHRSENEKLQQMFQQAPGFVAVMRGPSHVFEMCNAAYIKLTGYRDIIGKPTALALPETVAQGFITLLDQVYATGVPYIGNAVRYDMAPAPDSAPVESYCDFVFQPLFDDARQTVGIFVQGHDVTEQQQAQQRLLLADQQKDRFIATLAHELRNPLAPIRAAAHLLDSPHVQPDTVARVAPIISRQVNHMARLLDDLLDIARITQGRILLQKSYVAIDELVGTAIEAARPLIEAKQHYLTVDHRDGAIELEGDPIRLTQILSNLLTNAAKYSDPGASIRIESRRAGQSCVIAIHDSGIGLSAQSLSTIFKIFSQEHSALDRSEGGLGIGLALVKGLVGLHDGTIEAASDGVGKGSTFTVTLPCADAHRASAGMAPHDAGAASLGKRILIADDNVDLVAVLAEFLDMAGHRVITAHNGRDALELAGRERPDAAILDVGMPGMNGYELARAIRQEAWGRSMLLIAATGWGHEDDKFKAKAAGFDEHLTKPFAMEQLQKML